MNKRKNLILNNPGKKPIVYDIYYKTSNKPLPIVLFCHGYKGFKDWGAWHLVAEAFSEAGFFFLKFNFSHNGGTMEDPIDFPDLEAFSNNNYSKELDDLDRVLDHVTSIDRYHDLIDLDDVSIIGHSRGGGIAMIKAEEHPMIKRVISWAGVSDFKSRFFIGSKEFNKWKANGVSYVENGRTKQQMPHKFQFFEDFNMYEKRLTISRAVKILQIPQLIIQGAEDLAVSVSEAEDLHRWNPKSKLIILNEADHVFGSKHPWKANELPFLLNKIVNISIKFIKAN
jgi:pimeloyl-ACP methyl ester carboxylesterase